MTTYVRLVKGATKPKVAAPKPKYIEPILMATSRGYKDPDFVAIMRALKPRIQDKAWSIAFKALLVVHIMIREGESDVTLRYLSSHENLLDARYVSPETAVSHSDVRTLKHYSKYLGTRAREFGNVRVDYIRDETRSSKNWSSNKEEGGRLRQLSVEKGLLREVESVQAQIESLLKCKFSEQDVNNDLGLLCFKMLVRDLLPLYQALNEGLINMLEHYFEMSKVDAERALEIYKAFTRETEDVVAYLRVAKHLEYLTGLTVPTIKHAQTGLASSLEEYLHDPDFEINRRQYLASKDIKNGRLSPVKESQSQQQQTKEVVQEYNPFGQQQEMQLEQQQQQQQQQQLMQQQFEQQQMMQMQAQQLQAQQAQLQAQQQQQQQAQLQAQQQQQQQQQATGVVAQQTGFNPWDVNGFGFSSQPVQQTFSSQPIQQQQTFSSQPLQQQPFSSQPVQQPVQTGSFSSQPVQQPMATGTFSSQPTLNPAFTGAGFGGYGIQPIQESVGLPSVREEPANQPQQLNQQSTGTNPFLNGFSNQPIKRSSTVSKRASYNPFSLGQDNKPVETQSTGTNPFSNTRFTAGTTTTPFTFESQQQQQQQPRPLSVMSTGTNPFRSAAPPEPVQQQQPQQLKPQPTAGGLEKLPTIPVFPETQRQYVHDQAQMKAQMELERQKSFVQQQQTGFTNQQTGFNNGFTNQPTGFQMPQQTQQQTGFQMPQQQTGFQMPQQQQTGFNGFQQQATGYNAFQQTGYSGPSLI